MDFNRIPQSDQELHEMARALVNEMVEPLKGRVGNQGVILYALMLMHRQVVRSRPVEAQRDIGFLLAGYAGDLISAPSQAAVPQHKPHQCPSDLPTAIQ